MSDAALAAGNAIVGARERVQLVEATFNTTAHAEAIYGWPDAGKRHQRLADDDMPKIAEQALATARRLIAEVLARHRR